MNAAKAIPRKPRTNIINEFISGGFWSFFLLLLLFLTSDFSDYLDSSFYLAGFTYKRSIYSLKHSKNLDYLELNLKLCLASILFSAFVVITHPVVLSSESMNDISPIMIV